MTVDSKLIAYIKHYTICVQLNTEIIFLYN